MSAQEPANRSAAHRNAGKFLSRVAMRLKRIGHQMALQSQWWLQPGVPYQPLFVIASRRSGSNLLVEWLNQLPGVVCRGEILNWGFPFGPSRRASSKQAIQHLRRTLHSIHTPIRGCKLFLQQLENYRLTLDDLDTAFPGSKYIILYRQSLIEQFASLELARATSQWTLVAGQRPVFAPVTIEAAALTEFCEEMRCGYDRLIARPWLRQRAVLVSYEELIANPQHWFASEIGRLLGVTASTHRPGLRKQNPQPLEERIANYAELSHLATGPHCRQYHAWPPAAPEIREAA